MNGSELVLVQYSQIPGLVFLQSLGIQILGLALGLWLLVEMYRLLTRGACDFVTPIVRVGLALLVVQNIASIGGLLGGMAESVSRAILDANERDLFGQAFTHAVAQVFHPSSWDGLSDLFSFKGIVLLAASTLYFCMMLLKLALIDVLWPMCFGLVLVLGVLAVPLGILPGGSAHGWFRTLVEVSLWPVVFQMLVAMMVASFKGLLHQVVGLDAAAVFSQALAIGDDPSKVAVMGQGMLVLLRFWAICLGYCVFALGTPIIAGVAVRSAPVGALLGVALALGGRLMSAGKAMLSQMPFAARVSQPGAPAPSLGGASGDGAVTPGLSQMCAEAAGHTEALGRVFRTMAWSSSHVDQRSYPEPAQREART